MENLLQACKSMINERGYVDVDPDVLPEQRASILKYAKENGWDVRLPKKAEVTPVNDQEYDLYFVLTTGDIDRDNEILDPSGMIYEEFLKNPVWLWSHDMWSLPIGKIVNLTRTATGWAGGVKFVPADIDEHAGKVLWYYKNGYLHDASIRFRPLDWVSGKVETDGYFTKFTKWELLEGSSVTIGCNPKAGTGKQYAAGAEDTKGAIEKFNAWSAEMDQRVKDNTTRKTAADGPAGHAQAPAGSALTTGMDAGANLFYCRVLDGSWNPESESPVKITASHDGETWTDTAFWIYPYIHTSTGNEFQKSGAELSKKNRARLRAALKRIREAETTQRECGDDLEDLLSKWDDPEEELPEDKKNQGATPAQDTPASGETRKTVTADGDSDARLLAKAIREAAGKKN